METLGYLGAGVVLLVAGSFLTQHYVRRTHGVFSATAMRASQGNRTVPSWVSLVTLAGFGFLFWGVVRGVAGLLS